MLQPTDSILPHWHIEQVTPKATKSVAMLDGGLFFTNMIQECVPLLFSGEAM